MRGARSLRFPGSCATISPMTRPMTRWVFLLVLGVAVACSGAGGLTTEAATPGSPAGSPVLSPANTAKPTSISPAASPAPSPVNTAKPTPAVAATPPGVLETSQRPGVTVGAATFEVEPAVTSAQRTKGLSGHPPLAPGSGMLFIFERESKHTFWMIDMLFALDMVWIGAGCTVVDITFNAPPPEPGQTPDLLPRFAPGVPARYVLEINAGEAGGAGIRPGDPVLFTGGLAGLHGC